VRHEVGLRLRAAPSIQCVLDLKRPSLRCHDMGYEHFLSKQDPNRFSDADRAEMAAYLNRLPHLRWQGAWLLLPDAELRAARAHTLESTGDINFELNSSVRMVENEVWLTARAYRADPPARHVDVPGVRDGAMGDHRNRRRQDRANRSGADEPHDLGNGELHLRRER
jgi:hypothetical protein